MQELINNPVIQTALVAVIAAALNALLAVLKERFPTQAALVERNWCYLQPAVGAAVQQAAEALKNGAAGNVALGNIVAKSLTQFADQYALFEGRPAGDAEIAAARAEIAAAVKKVAG